MLFSFKSFIANLRENEEKKEIIEKHEKYIGSIPGNIKEQLWYKEYISQFEYIEYAVPEELKDDFDWELLYKLAAGSFSSDTRLIPIKNSSPEFEISVKSGDQLVIKMISELWGFQILRLYEIYTEEMMNLQILIAEDEKEKTAIMAQRESILLKEKSRSRRIELLKGLGIYEMM